MDAWIIVEIDRKIKGIKNIKNYKIRSDVKSDRICFLFKARYKPASIKPPANFHPAADRTPAEWKYVIRF